MPLADLALHYHALQAAGREVAIVSGETKRLHFAVKGYDAINSWDIYWTGRQVGMAFTGCCGVIMQHSNHTHISSTN